MKLIVDMNLSPLWVEYFSQRGVEASHWSQVGNPKADDPTILGWAREQGFVVFSHDLDFSRLLALTRASGPSVLQIRTEDVLPASVGELVLATLQQYRDILDQGALVVVDAATSRARILPLR